MIRISCSTLSCDGFKDIDFVKSFKFLPKAGFQYVEFNCWNPADLLPQKIIDIKRRCDRTGLVPIAVYGCSFGGNIKKDIAHKIRLIEAACELGCRRIVATGVAGRPEGGLEHVVKVLKYIVPFAEEKDILICLENHENNTLERTDDYVKIFNEVESENVGLCIDTGHFDAAGIEMMSLIESMHHKVNHIHLKENKGFGKKKFVKFGEGTTDNDNVVKKMIERGYNGFLNIELSPTVIGLNDDNRIEELTKAREMFKVFADAGN